MDTDTIQQIIEIGKDKKKQDEVIDLFIEGQNTLLTELDTMVNKLKRIDKDFCVDLLASQIEFLNDSLALATRRITKEQIASITPEQALLIASFNKIINDFEKEPQDLKQSVEIKISS